MTSNIDYSRMTTPIADQCTRPVLQYAENIMTIDYQAQVGVPTKKNRPSKFPQIIIEKQLKSKSLFKTGSEIVKKWENSLLNELRGAPFCKFG